MSVESEDYARARLQRLLAEVSFDNGASIAAWASKNRAWGYARELLATGLTFEQIKSLWSHGASVDEVRLARLTERQPLPRTIQDF